MKVLQKLIAAILLLAGLVMVGAAVMGLVREVAS
jgi:hypothetical protein